MAASFYDREIPVRSGIDFDFALSQLTSVSSPSLSSSSNETRILAFNDKRRGARRDYASFFLFSSPSSSSHHHRRYYKRIPQHHHHGERRNSTISADKVLDAPDLADDFSLNLLDWGSNNSTMAMALGSTLYVWDAPSSGDPSSDPDSLGFDEPISSVAWAPDGRRIAVGLEGSQVQLWDPICRRRITTLLGGCPFVGSLAWDGSSVLTTGGGDGSLVDHDIRVPSHSRAVHTYVGHLRDGRMGASICGLKWSDSRPKQLASGGLDGLVHVWDRRRSGQVHRLGNHTTAAVRALAWSPSHYRLLATGAGAGETHGCIEFWDTQSGTQISSVHVGSSQVFGLTWGRDGKEILSSCGSAGDLTLWSYQEEMVMTGRLVGHTHRVLYMAQSPDGCSVATASGGADETLRLWWDVFPSQEEEAAAAAPQGTFTSSSHIGIRQGIKMLPRCYFALLPSDYSLKDCRDPVLHGCLMEMREGALFVALYHSEFRRKI